MHYCPGRYTKNVQLPAAIGPLFPVGSLAKVLSGCTINLIGNSEVTLPKLRLCASQLRW